MTDNNNTFLDPTPGLFSKGDLKRGMQIRAHPEFVRLRDKVAAEYMLSKKEASLIIAKVLNSSKSDFDKEVRGLIAKKNNKDSGWGGFF